jgi:DNA-binding response OmpR family regulator
MKTILIVEDDPISSRALCDFLAANGYDTRVARTGPDGVAQFRAEAPDLMLVDVQLPLKNGFEVCFDVRKSERGHSVPILLMSAVYTDTEHAERYARDGLGAAAYLVKPFSMRAMLERVTALIGS